MTNPQLQIFPIRVNGENLLGLSVGNAFHAINNIDISDDLITQASRLFADFPGITPVDKDWKEAAKNSAGFIVIHARVAQ